jgi:general secretion pathway protein J
MKRTATTQRGFTLLEVLVTLLIMSLLSVLSWRALDYIQRTQSQLQDTQTRHQSIHAVLQQLEHDILQRHSSPLLNEELSDFPLHPDGIASAYSALVWGQHPRSSFLAIRQTATPPAVGNVWLQWRSENNVLYRDQGMPFATLPGALPAAQNPVLDDVQQFTARAWIPARGWMPLPLTQTTRAPTGIEITIVRLERGQSVRYRKVVPLS